MSLRDGLVTHPSVVQRLDHMIEGGSITADPLQRRIASALDHLIGEIASKRLESKSSALGWLFAKRGRSREAVKGLYIHGGVGRGKTMLMDMFHELVPVTRKRRAHFNDFMADTHDRIGRHREALKRGETRESDPIPAVARAIAGESWVLCFDEFSVTDIADAMILSRLFSALFAEGVVLVATSNVAPDDLYRDGLNRGLFLPFVDVLKSNTRIMPLETETDYRQEKLQRLPVYIHPLGDDADRTMDEAWAAMANGYAEKPTTVKVKGRELTIARSAGRAARFSFEDLCARPLAARDYLALAARYDMMVIDHVPVMGQEKRNEAKRFILLVDTLYDQGVRVALSAQASPDELYQGRTGAEVFEFERTASRLVEMQSSDWLDGWSKRQSGKAKTT